MSACIRYARGQSSLGDFIAALSDRGLVAFEFTRRDGDAVKSLDERFPQATLEEDAAGLATTVAALARLVVTNRPAIRVSLDLRGSDYEKRRVHPAPPDSGRDHDELRRDSRPDGHAAGRPRRDSRHRRQHAGDPRSCHRVVKKDGSLSGYRWGQKRKRELLARERAPAG